MTLAAPTVDPAWPAPLALLLGPEAGALVQTLLGGGVRALRVSSVAVQPSGATVVRWAATVERPDGTTDRELIAATTGSRIPEGAAVLAGEVGGEPVEVGLWRWPHDPALPALPSAADPASLAALLDGSDDPRLATVLRGSDPPPASSSTARRPGR
ncbi:MAG TPA: hypothetical protein VM367_12895 [Pseudonocardia sp.]|nr:hypothetical protein [Pseudonocardia sp.]